MSRKLRHQDLKFLNILMVFFYMFHSLGFLRENKNTFYSGIFSAKFSMKIRKAFIVKIQPTSVLISESLAKDMSQV